MNDKETDVVNAVEVMERDSPIDPRLCPVCKSNPPKVVNVFGLEKDTKIELQVAENGAHIINEFHAKYDTQIKQQKVAKGGKITNIF